MTDHIEEQNSRTRDDSDVHPARYPKHNDPLKGQVFNGECNRTACDNPGAVWWNLGTYGLYCPVCAAGINWRPGKFQLCVLVGEKPPLSEMETMKRQHGYYQADFA